MKSCFDLLSVSGSPNSKRSSAFNENISGNESQKSCNVSSGFPDGVLTKAAGDSSAFDVRLHRGVGWGELPCNGVGVDGAVQRNFSTAVHATTARGCTLLAFLSIQFLQL